MRRNWLGLVVLSAVVLCAGALEAQRFPQIMNMNTHEGKYATGGFGVGLGFGGGMANSIRRESLGTKSIGGEMEAVFKKRNAQSLTRTIFGADIDFQIGSDNSVIGTDFGIEIYSMALGTNATLDEDNDAYESISENATLIYAGFDFTINFFDSEFIETDGRRTRENWGLSLIVGPKVGLLFGGFSDLNGLASIGLDIGLMFDFPIGIPGAEDLLSISPYAFLEANYRFDIDGALVDNTAGSPTNGQDVLNDNFDIGFFEETQDVNGDGTADFPNQGLAVRRHNFIPAYQFNLGTSINLTPIFVSRSGGLINNWRFHMSFGFSVPIRVGFLFSDFNGAQMHSQDEVPWTWNIVLGASYFF
ncbi:MAG: hypothetical protein K8I27_09825 [Planctomycetes bacterium]|nr:hypothetical protein [Planctomycetota bacterium]